jgi:hypothetical protein
MCGFCLNLPIQIIKFEEFYEHTAIFDHEPRQDLDFFILNLKVSGVADSNGANAEICVPGVSPSLLGKKRAAF